MLHSRVTSAFLPHTTGPSCGQTYASTQKCVSAANRGRNQQTSLRRSIHYPIQNGQTSGYMLIFLAKCWLWHQHKYILCITDAFTKYALVTAVENKEAEMVAKAIFNEWFCKFGIPVQIHTDGRKGFVNKFSNELFQLLNVQHTKITLAYPQCNSHVEVFNKTVKNYLASFVDDTTLDWENFLLALMLSYNTSYHSTIATTPFKLLFILEQYSKQHPSTNFNKTPSANYILL